AADPLLWGADWVVDVIENAVEHRGTGQSRAHAVDAHTISTEVDGPCSCHCDDRTLGRRVGVASGHARYAGHAPHCDDRSAFAQLRIQGPYGQESASQIDGERAVPCVQ